jgi:hypothetical protein
MAEARESDVSPRFAHALRSLASQNGLDEASGRERSETVLPDRANALLVRIEVVNLA